MIRLNTAVRRALPRRLREQPGEAGMTLVELLVAATMSVIIVGAACAMLISAVRDQPALSRKAQNVTTARWQLERIVRELRTGVKVEPGASGSEVSILASVRRVSCGGAVQTSSSAEPIKCRVTYRCSGSACTRTESEPNGTRPTAPVVALTGVGNPTNVFCFVPSAEADPVSCGPVKTETAPTYVGVNLEVPNPSGPGLLTISDGATLRTAALAG
jgi:type II secretory pathway pseudopilin PulG